MSSTLDLRGLAWVKSTYSDGDGGECVEWSPSYARAHGIVPVRDSKAPTGPTLLLTPTAFTGLLALARLS
ncbi:MULTISPECIES: DUF397 domain-containing protein [unclassified Streptomyces]|uniref:DUF397 domain-containing protein n=1 Tax=unclassified Streptomyces TaxID=2593676 RepID=UPI000DD82075|nr:MULTISPECIES: DUF397 domain-containing protein [unclassified Streptomyces]QZZ29659.1 DUF397 domain-containing protein [Streptomyces sp. ST1015]